MIIEILWDGTPIGEPGLYQGVPMDAYHRMLTVTASISSSGQRTIWSESPAHYYDTSYLNPDPPEPKERPHFSLGRAAHHLLLQGRKGFDDEFAVRPDIWSDWRTNAAKDWRADTLAAGKTIITMNELNDIAGMAAALARDPLIRAGLLDGLVERSIIYKDQESGIYVKARPDAIPSDEDFSDLKTTEALDDDSIQRTITSFGYHQQGATVRSAARSLGLEMAGFTLVFVEKTRPFCVRTVTLKPEDLDRGEEQNRVANWKFAQGLATGYWPGPGSDDDAQFMGLQPYAQARIDARLAIEIPAIVATLYDRSTKA